MQPSVLVAAPSKGRGIRPPTSIAAGEAKPGEAELSHPAGIRRGLAPGCGAACYVSRPGFKAQHVPFKGPVEALTEVMAGRIDFYFLPVAPAIWR